MTHRIIETADAKRLRAYATRLMAFALKAVSDGDMDFAERLTARASKCLDDAQATEASSRVVQGLIPWIAAQGCIAAPGVPRPGARHGACILNS